MWFNVGYMLDKWFRDIRGSFSTRGKGGRRLLGLNKAKGSSTVYGVICLGAGAAKAEL